MDDDSLTENTRSCYPVEFIPNCVPAGRGGIPKNVVMLAADAFGVLPPIACRTPAPAMYPLLSASTYIELALQAAAASLGRDGQTLVLRDLRLGKACLLSTDSPVHLQTTLGPADGSYCISALGPDENWQEHARGSFEGRRARAPELPCWPIQEWTEVGAEFVDERARRWLFEYGPCFQTIRRGWVGPDEIMCKLDWPE